MSTMCLPLMHGDPTGPLCLGAYHGALLISPTDIPRIFGKVNPYLTRDVPLSCLFVARLGSLSSEIMPWRNLLQTMFLATCGSQAVLFFLFGSRWRWRSG